MFSMSSGLSDTSEFGADVPSSSPPFTWPGRFTPATSIGLFEQTSAGYGEIWYDVGGKKTVGRSVTAEAALETLYSLAGVTPRPADDEGVFRGHPLVTRAPGATLVFYVLWPAMIVSAGVWARG